MNTAEPHEHRGEHFGPYLLHEYLHHSDTTDIYKAEETSQHRIVLLKIFTPNPPHNTHTYQQLLHQIQQSQTHPYPHYRGLDHHGEINQRLYLELELMTQTTLAEHLQTYGALSSPRAVAILYQIAQALDTCADAGIPHDNLDTTSILLQDDDSAFLTALSAFTPTPSTQTPRTQTRYDIYLLSLILFEILTGQALITPTPPNTTTKQPDLTIPSLQQFKKNQFLTKLDTVIQRGLSAVPSQRYQRAQDLAQAALEALPIPEQHQVHRILRRVSTFCETDHVLLSEEEQHSSYSSEQCEKNSDGIELSDNLHSLSSQQSIDDKPLPITMLRNPDFGTYPLPMPKPQRASRHSYWRMIASIIVVVVSCIIGVTLIPAHTSSAKTVAIPAQHIVVFPGIDYRLSPGNLALDSDHNLYVTTLGMRGKITVLSSSHNADSAAPLVASQHHQPHSLAVNNTHDVYFTDDANHIMKIDHSDQKLSTLPITDLDNPTGIALDAEDKTLYIVDHTNNQVIRFDTTTKNQTTVPFTGLNNPTAIAVDHHGGIYVTDTGNHRVLKMPPASTTQIILPFTGIQDPYGITLDHADGVYVTDNRGNRVLKLAEGSRIPTVLAFTGLNAPLGVAVDPEENVYVADRGNDRVLSLPASSVGN